MRPRPPIVAVLALVALGLNLVNTVLGEVAYVVVNLVVAGCLVAASRRAGIPWPQLGLARADVRRGSRLGVAALLVVALAVITLAAIPSVQGRFRVQGASVAPGDVAWALFVRIPFGTVLPEELLFRAAGFGVLLTSTSPRRAAAWSSFAFGLWHVLPTLDADSAVSGGVGTVLVAVAATTLAGLVFVWLRVRSGSIVAPVLAHWSVNSTSLLVAHVLAGSG